MADLGLDNLGHVVRERLKKVSESPAFRATMNRVVSRTINDVRVARRDSRCLITGCDAEPIESHVIPHGFLKHLDPRGAPLTPTYVQGTGKVLPMRSAGVPTFPGYCGSSAAGHDQKLFPWETSRRFPRDDDAVRLQLMRTVDARIHEVGLRQELLERVSVAVAPEQMGAARDGLNHAEVARWRDEVNTFRAASQDARALLDDLGRLVSRLRDPADFGDDDRAHCLAIRTGVTPMVSLVDAAWVLTSPPDLERRAPIAVCVLADESETVLLVGTTREGAGVLRGIDRSIRGARELATYIQHWVQWGSQCWYASSSYWDLFTTEDRDKIERGLALVPHVKAAFYDASDYPRIPIIRPGNGWV